MFLAGRMVGGGVPRRLDQMQWNNNRMNPKPRDAVETLQSVSGNGKMEQSSILTNAEVKEKVRASLKRKMFTTMDEYEEVRKKVKVEEKAVKKAESEAKRRAEMEEKRRRSNQNTQPFSAASLRRELQSPRIA